MKLYPNNLLQLTSNIVNGQIKGVVIYGPNKGLITNTFKEIVQKLKYNVSSYSFNKQDLSLILNNYSLFSKKEIIKFTNVDSTIDANTKEILLNNNLHLPIFIGDELTGAPNSLRYFFEQSTELAIIACYDDDARSIKTLITNLIIKEQKTITVEALDYLLHHLTGDRNFINNELEKLMICTPKNYKITISDCIAIISSNVEAKIELLCIYYAQQQFQLFEAELLKLLANNTNTVWIIRALSRYFTNLLIAKLLLAEGKKIEEVCKLIKPPIFFKYINNFQDIVLRLNISSIYRQLKHLFNNEINLKNTANSELIIHNLIYNNYSHTFYKEN